MKVRKVFENSKEDQKEDVEIVFTEFTDENGSSDYRECVIEYDNPNYMMVTIYESKSDPVSNNIKEFDEIFKEREESLKLLKRIRYSLLNLDHYNYKWGF